MPKRKRSHGFTHTKTGRYHRDDGGAGRGTSGRRKVSSDLLVGEMGDESLKSPSPSLSSLDDVASVCESDESSSNATESFQHALSPDGISPSPSPSPTPSPSPQLIIGPEAASNIAPFQRVVNNTLALIRAVLPKYWIIIQAVDGYHTLQLSRGSDPAIQRNVFVSFTGNFRITVHRKPISEELHSEFMQKGGPVVPLTEQSSRVFVDKVLSVVLAVKSFEVCAGVDNLKYEVLWKSETGGEVDNNPYDETRYVKTFRSSECSFLVPIQIWLCEGCKKITKKFRKKIKCHLSEDANPFTKNAYLDEKQVKSKMKAQSKMLKSARSKIDYLTQRVKSAIETDGVNLDSELGNDLTEILRDTTLTPIQNLFLQQQYKSSLCKGSSGMRWHPSMIRFALLIKSTSSAAYHAIQSSGVIRLPSERTLFDYSHAVPRSEGLFQQKIFQIGEKVSQFKEEHKHYHCLLMDEIHISQKLVYRKSDGSLVGYVNLNEVETELQELGEIMNNDSSSHEPQVASKILAYMIKGANNSVKEVIAAYPVGTLTKEQLFDRTWEVIRACELSGIKILAVVGDGSSVNRAFFRMHTPVTPHSHGIVFDTINMCSPDRKIFFISDPPHLIKTIRNCFAKSGISKRCTRLLKKAGKVIVWKVIERLLMEDIKLTLRMCHKLNTQNVYLNSYSCMKVSYAAQVLSGTVAKALKYKGWPGNEVTADFIQRVNDFFDQVNGAHTEQSTRTANENLAPYKSVDDKRFEDLKKFENYFIEWEKEVNSLQGISDKEKAKMMLSRQTLEGIFITVNGFIGATKFLLQKNAGFVNGRLFCQDPLEQYFSKQRASGGGRQNPTVSSFIATDTRITIHRDLNVRKKSGNTEAVTRCMDVIEEPLPKRKKK